MATEIDPREALTATAWQAMQDTADRNGWADAQQTEAWDHQYAADLVTRTEADAAAELAAMRAELDAFVESVSNTIDRHVAEMARRRAARNT